MGCHNLKVINTRLFHGTQHGFVDGNQISFLFLSALAAMALGER